MAGINRDGATSCDFKILPTFDRRPGFMLLDSFVLRVPCYAVRQVRTWASLGRIGSRLQLPPGYSPNPSDTDSNSSSICSTSSPRPQLIGPLCHHAAARAPLMGCRGRPCFRALHGGPGLRGVVGSHRLLASVFRDVYPASAADVRLFGGLSTPSQLRC